MHASLTRFWDHDRLPPPGLFDPRDEAQFNVLALHLLGLYWRHQQVEAFAAFCALCGDELRRQAASLLGAELDGPPDLELRGALDPEPDPARDPSRTPGALVDALLAEFFMASGRAAPRLLHLRAYARSRLAALAEARSRAAPERGRRRLARDPAAYLAGVE